MRRIAQNANFYAMTLFILLSKKKWLIANCHTELKEHIFNSKIKITAHKSLINKTFKAALLFVTSKTDQLTLYNAPCAEPPENNHLFQSAVPLGYTEHFGVF